MQLNVFISLLWLFDAIWIYIKNQNLKNEKIRMISIFSGMGQILCGMEQLLLCDFFYKLLTRRYIFQLTKYEHNKGVSESVDFDMNFSSVGLAELLFLKRAQL